MIRTGNYTQTFNIYDNFVNKKKEEKVNNTNVKEALANKPVVKSSESKLSQKAQEYLEKLREEYGDYDFIVADKGDNHKALLGQSTKEFSVMLSSDEIEKMANNEEYANEMMQKVDAAVQMSLRICEEYGYERNFGDNLTPGTYVNKLAVSFNEDGSMSIYASLERLSEGQMERMEKMKEQRAKEKEANEKTADEKTDKAYKVDKEKKENMSVKRTVIKAESEEDLISKLKEFDWNKISEEQKNEGTRVDFFA